MAGIDLWRCSCRLFHRECAVIEPNGKPSVRAIAQAWHVHAAHQPHGSGVRELQGRWQTIRGSWPKSRAAFRSAEGRGGPASRLSHWISAAAADRAAGPVPGRARRYQRRALAAQTLDWRKPDGLRSSWETSARVAQLRMRRDGPAWHHLGFGARGLENGRSRSSFVRQDSRPARQSRRTGPRHRPVNARACIACASSHAADPPRRSPVFHINNRLPPATDSLTTATNA